MGTRRGESRPLAVRRGRLDDTVTALYREGEDLWFVEVLVFPGEEGGARLRAGEPLRAVLAAGGGAVERWRFADAAAAERAAAWALRRADGRKEVELAGALAVDGAAWGRRARVQRPRIARFEVARSGPVAATVDRTHPWLFPRPPATSFLSGRVMVPVLSLVGAIDARLGARAGVFVSACPQAVMDPSIDHVFEVHVQDPARPGRVDAYFESGDRFWSVHLSLQVSTMDGVRWAVTEHSGRRGAPGLYRTTHAATRPRAEALFAARAEEIGRRYRRVEGFGPWHRRLLEEIDHHARVKGQRPRALRLRPAVGPFVQSVAGPFSQPSRAFLDYRSEAIGGAPHFCQDGWESEPKLPGARRGSLLHVLSLAAGDALWSESLNDGDAGTFNLFVAPGEPFGSVMFACH